MIALTLFLVAVLLALGPIAAFVGGDRRATAVTYVASFIVTSGLAAIGVADLVGGASSAVALPLGLPWVGAHFHIDALT